VDDKKSNITTEKLKILDTLEGLAALRLLDQIVGAVTLLEH
jgi:hypothetical protein